MADGDDKEVMLANKVVDLLSTSTIFSHGGITDGWAKDVEDSRP